MNISLPSLLHSQPKTFLLHKGSFLNNKDELCFRIFLKLLLVKYANKSSDCVVFCGCNPQKLSISEAIAVLENTASMIWSTGDFVHALPFGIKDSQLVLLTNGNSITSTCHFGYNQYSSFEFIAWSNDKSIVIPRIIALLGVTIPCNFYRVSLIEPSKGFILDILHTGQITQSDLDFWKPSPIEDVNVDVLLDHLKRLKTFARLIVAGKNGVAISKLLNRLRYMRQVAQINAVNVQSERMGNKVKELLQIKLKETKFSSRTELQSIFQTIVVPVFRELLEWESSSRLKATALFRNNLSFLMLENNSYEAKLDEFMVDFPDGEVLKAADASDLFMNSGHGIDHLVKMQVNEKKKRKQMLENLFNPTVQEEKEEEVIVEEEEFEFVEDATDIFAEFEVKEEGSDCLHFPMMQNVPAIRSLLSLPRETPILTFAANRSLTHYHPYLPHLTSLPRVTACNGGSTNHGVNYHTKEMSSKWESTLLKNKPSVILPSPDFFSKAENPRLPEDYSKNLSSNFGAYGEYFENKGGFFNSLKLTTLEREQFSQSEIYTLFNDDSWEDEDFENDNIPEFLEQVDDMIKFEVAKKNELQPRDIASADAEHYCINAKQNCVYRAVLHSQREILTTNPLNALFGVRSAAALLAAKMDAVLTVGQVLDELKLRAKKCATKESPSFLHISPETGRVLQTALILHPTMYTRNETLFKELLAVPSETGIQVGDIRFWYLVLVNAVEKKFPGTNLAMKHYEDIKEYVKNLLWTTLHSASLSGLPAALQTRLPFAAGLFLCANYSDIVRTNENRIDLPRAPEGTIDPKEIYLTCVGAISWAVKSVLNLPVLSGGANNETELKRCMAYLAKFAKDNSFRTLQILLLAAAGKVGFAFAGVSQKTLDAAKRRHWWVGYVSNLTTFEQRYSNDALTAWVNKSKGVKMTDVSRDVDKRGLNDNLGVHGNAINADGNTRPYLSPFLNQLFSSKNYLQSANSYYTSVLEPLNQIRIQNSILKNKKIPVDLAYIYDLFAQLYMNKDGLQVAKDSGVPVPKCNVAASLNENSDAKEFDDKPFYKTKTINACLQRETNPFYSQELTKSFGFPDIGYGIAQHVLDILPRSNGFKPINVKNINSQSTNTIILPTQLCNSPSHIRSEMMAAQAIIAGPFTPQDYESGRIFALAAFLNPETAPYNQPIIPVDDVFDEKGELKISIDDLLYQMMDANGRHKLNKDLLTPVAQNRSVDLTDSSAASNLISHFKFAAVVKTLKDIRDRLSKSPNDKNVCAEENTTQIVNEAAELSLILNPELNPCHSLVIPTLTTAIESDMLVYNALVEMHRGRASLLKLSSSKFPAKNHAIPILFDSEKMSHPALSSQHLDNVMNIALALSDSPLQTVCELLSSFLKLDIKSDPCEELRSYIQVKEYQQISGKILKSHPISLQDRLDFLQSFVKYPGSILDFLEKHDQESMSDRMKTFGSTISKNIAELAKTPGIIKIVQLFGKNHDMVPLNLFNNCIFEIQTDLKEYANLCVHKKSHTSNINTSDISQWNKIVIEQQSKKIIEQNKFNRSQLELKKEKILQEFKEKTTEILDKMGNTINVNSFVQTQLNGMPSITKKQEKKSRRGINADENSLVKAFDKRFVGDDIAQQNKERKARSMEKSKKLIKHVAQTQSEHVDKVEEINRLL